MSGEYPYYEGDIPGMAQKITGSIDQHTGEIVLKTYAPTVYCYTGSDGSYLSMAGPSPASQCEIFSPVITGSRLFCDAKIISGLSSSLAAGTEKVFFLPKTQYHETDWSDPATIANIAPGEAWYDITNIPISGAYAENRFAGPTGTPTQLSRTLGAYNYSYSIPSAAVITGIEARVFRKAKSASLWYNAENTQQSSSYGEMDSTIVIPGAHSQSLHRS